MNGYRPKIVVVDDDEMALASSMSILEDRCDAEPFLDSYHAETYIRENAHDIDVVISDQRMPGRTGAEFLAQIRPHTRARFILLTGYSDLPAVVQAVNEGQIWAYVEKASPPMELVDHVFDAAADILKERTINAEAKMKTLSESRGSRQAIDAAILAGADLWQTIHSINAIVVACNQQGIFERVYGRVEDILGWSAVDLTSRPFIEFVHPDDRLATLDSFADLVGMGKSVNTFCNRYRRKDGGYTWLLWSACKSFGTIYSTAIEISDSIDLRERINSLEGSRCD